MLPSVEMIILFSYSTTLLTKNNRFCCYSFFFNYTVYMYTPVRIYIYSHINIIQILCDSCGVICGLLYDMMLGLPPLSNKNGQVLKYDPGYKLWKVFRCTQW